MEGSHGYDLDCNDTKIKPLNAHIGDRLYVYDKHFRETATMRKLFGWIDEVVECDIWYNSALDEEELQIIKQHIFICTDYVFELILRKYKYIFSLNNLQCLGSICLIISMKHILYHDWDSGVKYFEQMILLSQNSFTCEQLADYEFEIIKLLYW
jgi:hypothetical protein